MIDTTWAAWKENQEISGRIEFDPSGRDPIVIFSPGMKKMLGISHSDPAWQRVLDTHLSLLIPQEEAAAWTELVHRAQRTGEPVFLHGHLRAVDQRMIPVLGVLDRLSKDGQRMAASFYYCRLEDETGRTVTKHLTAQGHIVEIVTFGIFTVLVDQKPILFHHEKARELLALLVDRRGAYCTSQSLIACLWENEAATKKTYARLRKVTLRLRDTLRDYGVEDILESRAGNRRIVPERVNCDLYEYLNGEKRRSPKFHGTYLSDYSWGEDTLAELTNGL